MYSRGEAIGIALGLLWVYPFITILVCIFVGWWGLLTYPILVTMAAIELYIRERGKHEL